MKKINLIIIIIIVIISLIFIFFDKCDIKPFNRNKYCYCPPNAQKTSIDVVECFVPPCPQGPFYGCKYFECIVNSDCPKGESCSGQGKCNK